ncbi:unnamed protein product [Closterium sp. NIES-53]
MTIGGVWTRGCVRLVVLLCGTMAASALPAHVTRFESVPGLASWNAATRVENISRVSTWQDDLDRLPPLNSTNRRRLAACDYTVGRWVYDARRRSYSSKCAWIRSAFNCERNGRRDTGYTKYTWKPSACTVRRFDRAYFKALLRNKVVAFVGDSFSRNLQQAIACELGVDDHVEPWSGWLGGTLVSGLAVPRYNLKLVAVVAPYLVRYSNQDWAFRQYGLRPGDGSRYVVWLDHMDDQWAAVLQHVDLAVFMSGHWFLDKQGAEAVRSTVYVANNRVVRLSGMSAYRAAIRSVKRFVTVEQRYRGVPMWLTYSPSHYSRGNPPTCRHTTPISTKRVQAMVARDISTAFRRLEVRELKKSPFRIIDITRISLFRPDAHVKRFYGAKTNSKTKWDCTHWCLPGLPDVWADIFQFVLKTQLRRRKK